MYISLYMTLKFLLISNSVNELRDYWNEYSKAPAVTRGGGETIRDYLCDSFSSVCIHFPRSATPIGLIVIISPWHNKVENVNNE